jgi:hypothetical protein
MLIRVLSCTLLIATVAPGGQSAAWSQAVRAQENSMLTPPPVSIEAYPKEVGSEVGSNYLRYGVTLSAGYIDNLYASSGNAPVVGEMTFSIRPTISLDTTSYRQHTTLLYSPSFTFYRPTSELNCAALPSRCAQTDQNLIFNYQFRLTPHITINANDRFLKTSTLFNPSSSFPGASISSSGSPQVIITPSEGFLTNAANGSLSAQFSPTGMIGISGNSFILRYPDLAQVPGLYESNELGGGFFYNRRITGTQYIGANYRYGRVLASPTGAEFETQTDTIYFFYTIYLKQHLSLSVSGGPQYYKATQTFTTNTTPAAQQAESGQIFIPASSSWTPAVATSLAWQERHTNFGASYARAVTSGGGLLGTFDSNSASATARWQMSRRWTSGGIAGYSNIKTVNPGLFSSTQGGHTFVASVSIEHPLTDRLIASFEYGHVHQSYSGIAVISANPDSNRFMGSVSWQFARPLGR